MLTRLPDLADVEQIVRDTIAKVMKERGLPAREIEEGDSISATLGLRSMDLAQLVFELEMAFGTDPFEKLIPVTSVRTAGDLIRAYKLLYAAEPGDERGSAELAEAQQESNRRRQRRGIAG